MEWWKIILTQCYGFLMGMPIMAGLLFKSLFRGWKKVFIPKVRTDPPKLIKDESFGKHGFLNLPEGKIRIHYVDSGSSGDKRPLMLFLHGFPDVWFTWRKQLAYFKDKYRCVAIDNRGYGESDKPEGVKNYTITRLANDVKEVINLLGYQKCILLGHDWGGAIGYAFSSMYPEMVSVYVPINIAHKKSFAKELNSSWSQRLRSWYIFFFQCPKIPEIVIGACDFEAFDGMFGDIPVSHAIEKEEAIEAYKYYFSQPGALTGPINYYRAAIQHSSLSDNASGMVKVPVLCIFGTGDKYITLAAARGSCEYVEDFTLKEIQGGCHWIHLEEPSAVNTLIEEYLNQRKDLL